MVGTVERTRRRAPAKRRVPRKRGEQLPLFRPRGGRRPGAGRKPRGPRASERHKTRPVHHARCPVHVVLRVVRDVGSLRRRRAYQAFREAVIVAARRDDFRIVHLSLQRTHVHRLVEAADKLALARGLQGFQISAARHLNRALAAVRGGTPRRGTVFPDRYHAEPIGSPRQARHAMNYVLNNWRKHREDVVGEAARWRVDPFSSALMFPDWAERAEAHFLWRGPPTYEPLLVRRPTTWLLREGWKRAGTISYRAVPSRPGDPGRVTTNADRDR
jgi:REP element-mobilizing transposase RayT